MAYNLGTLRTSVRTKINDSSFSASTVDEAINDAIHEISGLFPFKWFAKRDTSGTLTVGSDTYNNPSDLEITSGLILIHPTDATKYWDITDYRMNPDEFFNLYPSASSLSNAQPVYWTEYGNKIYFNCPADLAYKVTQLYQKIPTDLTADADVPELPVIFREAIKIGGSYRCEEQRENYDIAGVLQNRFNDKVSDLMTRFANDTLAGPDTVILPQRQTDDW